MTCAEGNFSLSSVLVTEEQVRMYYGWGKWRTLLHMRQANASCSLTRW